jgi:hypothetical protein
VKYGSFNISNKRAIQLIVVFAVLLVLFGSGCNTVSPKLQVEYISEGMCRVLDEYLLFFTPTGKCLDFRGDAPTWQNY